VIFDPFLIVSLQLFEISSERKFFHHSVNRFEESFAPIVIPSLRHFKEAECIFDAANFLVHIADYVAGNRLREFLLPLTLVFEGI